MEVKGKGRLVVRVYTSRAELPIVDATVVVTQRNQDGKYKLLSVQATNSSGMTQPITIPTPLLGESTHPGAQLPPLPSVTCGQSTPAMPCCWWRGFRF